MDYAVLLQRLHTFDEKWMCLSDDRGLAGNVMREAAAAISELTRDKKDIVTDLIGLEGAIEEWPKLPPLPVLRNLGGHMAKWPEDWERGKAMQNELGLDAIPPKTEYECGAGLWDRITNGAWRNCLSRGAK